MDCDLGLISSLIDACAETVYGSTPLHEAAQHGHADICYLLLNNGAVSMPNSDRLLPQEIAQNKFVAAVLGGKRTSISDPIQVDFIGTSLPHDLPRHPAGSFVL